MTKHCKLFLMSSVTYKEDESKVSSYIQIMRSFISKYPHVKEGLEYSHLNSSEVFYEESQGAANLDEVSIELAIDMARGFSMCSIKNIFGQFEKTDARNDLFKVLNCKPFLLYDSHAFFTIIYEIDITFSDEHSQNLVISSIFKGRKIFENLKILEYVESCKRAAVDKIVDILNQDHIVIRSEEIQFENDNTLPFIIFPDAFMVDKHQFRNEESISLIDRQNGVAFDYENCFFHPGWNYTIASGFPTEVMVSLLQMTIRAQSFFFSLGYMKSYYTRELTKTINEKDSIAEFHVDTAEDVQLAFYDLLAKFNAYKNKLFPKYHAELSELMSRWHCDSDIDYIKSYIELDIQSKDRIHRSKIEKQNDRQNKALTFIALVQLISIYGAFVDGNAIFNENMNLFLVGTVTWTVSLIIYLLVSKFFRWAAFFVLIFSISTVLVLKGLV